MTDEIIRYFKILTEWCLSQDCVNKGCPLEELCADMDLSLANYCDEAINDIRKWSKEE